MGLCKRNREAARLLWFLLVDIGSKIWNCTTAESIVDVCGRDTKLEDVVLLKSLHVVRVDDVKKVYCGFFHDVVSGESCGG